MFLRRSESIRILQAAHTRDGGFQEEKYEDFNIPISWRREQLLELVNRRIGELYRRQYTGESVDFYDVFPEKYRQESDSFNYLLVRTQYRPRDIIAFINEILIVVAGKADITAHDIDRAEMEYSKKRLQALCTEWRDEHPNLEVLVETLRNLPSHLSVEDITDHNLESRILALAVREDAPDDFPQFAERYVTPDPPTDCPSMEEFRILVILTLYKVGVLGIKPSGYEKIHFSYKSSYVIRREDIRSESTLLVSPMLWMALGCRKVRGKGDVATSLW